MTVTRRLAAIVTALLALATFDWTVAAGGQTASNTQKEDCIANAVNMSNVGNQGASEVEITITRYTPDEARDRLMSTFRENGPAALLKALQAEPPVGNIRAPGSLSYDLRYARQLPGEEGGRRIVLATDRPVGFAEAANSSRTMEYPFTLVELRLERDGHGEGKVRIAPNLALNDNVLGIETYAAQPVMMTYVRKS